MAKYLGDQAGGFVKGMVGGSAGQTAGEFAQRFTSGVVSQRIRMAVYNQGKLDYAANAADAFGNQVGQGLVDDMTQPSEAARLAANRSLLNAMEQQADPDSYTTPQAGSGLRLGTGGPGLRLNSASVAEWSDQVDAGIRNQAQALAASEALERSIKDQALAMANFKATSGQVWAQEDAEAAARALAARPAEYARADAYHRELSRQARDAQVQAALSAADPLDLAGTFAQTYPALGRQLEGYNQLIAAGAMTQQEARNQLLASPRAHATLRSDYEAATATSVNSSNLTPRSFIAASPVPVNDPYERARENLGAAFAIPVIAAPVAGYLGASTLATLGRIYTTVGPAGTASLGFVTGGGMDAAGQLWQSGSIRWEQSIFAGTIGAVSGPIGATSGLTTNIALGSAGSVMNTAFNNYYYSEDSDLLFPAILGGAFGAAGYHSGTMVTKGVNNFIPEISYPNLNPRIPLLFQAPTVSIIPGVVGVTAGGVTSGVASFVPAPPPPPDKK